jgi:hypothetical protein
MLKSKHGSLCTGDEAFVKNDGSITKVIDLPHLGAIR